MPTPIEQKIRLVGYLLIEIADELTSSKPTPAQPAPSVSRPPRTDAQPNLRLGWTKNDVAMLHDLTARGMSDEQIASVLGRSIKAIEWKRRRTDARTR